jgi:PAS domain S-box-containing protein
MGKGSGERNEDPLDVRVRLSEARLARAQAVGHVGSWELDLVKKTMWASEEAFRLYGVPITPDQQMPVSFAQSIPLPEYRAPLDRALEDLIAGRRPYDIEFRIRRERDGAILDVHSRAVLVTDSVGRPVRVDGTIQDVTARKQMERALRAGEERTRMMLEQAADAILLGNPQGVLISVNEKAAELSGYAREEMLGKNISFLFDQEVLEAVPLRYDLLEQGCDVVRERKLTRKDGSAVPVEMHAKKLSDGTLQAILRDTTERKRTEEQLQLRQRMASIGTLAGGIAHDFNNLLAAIMGYADLLALEPTLDSHQRTSVESILRACRRGADLVGGLASLARSGQTEKDSFDLGKAAGEVVNVLTETTDRRIEKRLVTESEPCFVLGNESDIFHALMNLGINAVQAIESRGARAGDRVEFVIGRHEVKDDDPEELQPGPYIRVFVRDTGPGMAPSVRQRAFDPLFTTKQKGVTKGQGLGLTMVFNTVVTQHNGHIQVDSLEGEGTSFRLLLKEGSPTPVPPSRVPALTGGNGETILVIDDEPQILEVTQIALARAGFHVLIAADGAAALDVFRRNMTAVDAVVLDRSLPGMAGEEVLAALLDLDPDLTVIVSSGDATVGLEQFPGAVRLLRKPYVPSVLCSALQDVLRS